MVGEWIKELWHTCACAHTHIMVYYVALKEKEILPLATTWLDLEGIVVNERSQPGTHKHCRCHMHSGSKQVEVPGAGSSTVVAGGWVGERETLAREHELPARRRVSSGDPRHSVVTGSQSCVVYLESAKRADLTCPRHAHQEGAE